VAAAIANAVHHAIGVRFRSLPITIDALLGELPSVGTADGRTPEER
jgi:xanthine dehydrogenase YagR molybdenum-binding subunit